MHGFLWSISMASQGSIARRSARQVSVLRDYLTLLGTKFELSAQLKALTTMKRSPRKPDENRLKELTLMVDVVKALVEQLNLKLDSSGDTTNEQEQEVQEENEVTESELEVQTDESEPEPEVVEPESTDEKPKRKRG